ncbi:hypothetical protein [Rouxiella sp. WC2420]|uniref:Uncharacterized protein n=1 Tax=Rouxiella sp. WC2420 TaxID=3234145 RepID=A0AB39VKZ1_9GAMM
MKTISLHLEASSWDITLDDLGNIKTTQNPYAVAQDVACACSTFLGEAWYDTTLGIPYFERILGHWPGTQLITSKLQSEALKLSYVQSASGTVVIGRSSRLASGVLTITDTNGVSSTVNL